MPTMIQVSQWKCRGHSIEEGSLCDAAGKHTLDQLTLAEVLM